MSLSTTWVGDPFPNSYPGVSIPSVTTPLSDGLFRGTLNVGQTERILLTIDEVNALRVAAGADPELGAILKKFARLIDVSVDL